MTQAPARGKRAGLPAARAEAVLPGERAILLQAGEQREPACRKQ